MIKTETIWRYESRMSARMYFFLCMLTNINPNMNKLSWAINYTRAGWAPGCLELLLLAASLEATRHHIPQLSSSNIQTCSANCTNTFYNWRKYIFYFWQIHSTLVPLDTTFPGCPQATYRHSLVMSYLPSNSRSLPLIILSYLSSFFVLIFFDSSLLLFTANLCIPDFSQAGIFWSKSFCQNVRASLPEQFAMRDFERQLLSRIMQLSLHIQISYVEFQTSID